MTKPIRRHDHPAAPASRAAAARGARGRRGTHRAPRRGSLRRRIKRWRAARRYRRLMLNCRRLTWRDWPYILASWRGQWTARRINAARRRKSTTRGSAARQP